jgi:hypothetical protein
MRKTFVKVLVMCIIMMLAMVPVVSADNVFTVPKVRTAPVLDGDLGDEAWKIAEKAGTKFTDFQLHSGAEAPVKTEAWMVWDGEYLYVAFRNYQNMRVVTKNQTEFDSDIAADDDNEVFLAPAWPEPNPYYQLACNPAGYSQDRRGSTDTSWNSGFTVATKELSDSWTSEFKIPLANVGNLPKVGDAWGFNITRHWVFVDSWITFVKGLSEGFHQPSKFYTLQFGDFVD